MAKLQAAIGTQEVVFLGRGVPFDYEAGVFSGNSFPAGTSLKIIVGTDALDYQELKVKGGDFSAVWSVLKDLGRGVMVRIHYRPAQGRERPAELVSVELVGKG